MKRKVTVPDWRSRITSEIMRQSKVYVTGDERVVGHHAKAPLFQVARRLSSEWEDSIPDERRIITDELWDLVEPLIPRDS